MVSASNSRGRLAFGVLVLSSLVWQEQTARAVPAALQCANETSRDCVRDDIFIMDGSSPALRRLSMAAPQGCRTGSLRDADLVRWNCFFDFSKIEARFLAILKEKNVTASWDEVVFFTIDSNEPAGFGGDTDPMVFVRTGGAEGVNEVEGIGLPVKPRLPSVPYVGYVVGGSTTTFGIWQPPLRRPVPPNVKWFPLPDPAGVEGFEMRYRNCGANAYCNDGFTGYQALAQVSSHMFGPYLREEPELAAKGNWFAFQGPRSSCSPINPSALKRAVPEDLAPSSAPRPDGGADADAGGSVKAPLPEATLDTKGLPLPDLTQRAGTRVMASSSDPLVYGEPILSVCPDAKATLAQSMRPPWVTYDLQMSAFTGGVNNAGSAYGKLRSRIWNSFLDLDGSLMGGGANWVENGNRTTTNGGPNAFRTASPPYRGRRMVVFHPLELWLMGFMPPDGISVDYYDVRVKDVAGDLEFPSFSNKNGPRMGLPRLPYGQVGADPMTLYSEAKRQTATLGALLGGNARRTPSFEQAPHRLRQLWVVVTKPEDKVTQVDYSDDECTGTNKDSTCDSGRLETINNDHIEHMIRWRRAWQEYFYMLTGYTGRMNSTFDQTHDDMPYWEFIQKQDDQKAFTAEGGLRFDVSGPRLDTASANILSYASISTPGEQGTLTFTAHTQQLPTRIDGRLHQRPWGGSPEDRPFVVGGDNALLVRMAFPKRERDSAPKAHALMKLSNGPTIRIPGDLSADLVFDGKFHTYAVDLRKVPEYQDKIYDGFKFVPSTAVIDCDPSLAGDGEDDLNCIKLDYIRFTNVPDPDEAGDYDLDCNRKSKPDGFIGLEDNCPKLFNPGQEDADGNGIGDDCEDFDRDGVLNRCDNCPTLTNARQGDRDGNNVGDTCDAEYRGGCFLQPDSVATGRPRWPLIVFVFLGLVALPARRLLSRRK